MSKKKVMIAAGGTGGHIYPALAIAEAFKKKDVEVEFVGTASGLENKLIPKQGYKLHHLPIGKLNSNVPVRERLITLLKLPLALIKSFYILLKDRPAFVLGVGGYASGPIVLVASLMRMNTGLWEPNAMPGMANRILAPFVGGCWVIFNEVKDHLSRRAKVHPAGMPLREEIETLAGRVLRSSSEEKPLKGTRFRILVFGGSQGARAINNAMIELVKREGAILSNVEIVHQTGAQDFQRIKEAYGPLLDKYSIALKEYIYDMAEVYQQSDLVICRSGIGTLSELAACGLPSILIPLPTAADDHQRKNAESLVMKGAATMILQKDLSAERLENEILKLMKDQDLRRKMSANIKEFYLPKAADKLVNEFLLRMT